MYVNDIADNLLSLVRLFADDSSLFFSAANLRDIEGIINHDLGLISVWAKKWLVDFNPIKTVAMLFTLRPLDFIPILNFNDSIINFVQSHKHLGITLTFNGQWHTHIETILCSAYKVLGIMRKLKYRFTRQALNQMYVSYVRPLLEYSSIVWDGCSEQDKTALERLQNEVARIVTGLTKSTSLVNLYKECGWDSLSKRRFFPKKCVLYISAPKISFLTTYLTLFPHWLVRSLTILYVIDTILQVCILIQKYPANLAFPHLYLAGLILIITLESLTALSPFAANLKMMF